MVVNALALRPTANGARFFLERLLRHLPDVWEDARIAVLAPDDVPLDPDLRVEVVRLRGGSGIGRVVREMRALPSYADELGADVVVSPHEAVPARLKVPVVVVAQNLLYHCERVGPLPVGPLQARLRSRAQFAFYRRQMPRAYRRADAVVAVSAHAAETLRNRAGLASSRVYVTPCGADRLPVFERRPIDAVRRLVIVGAVAYYKRLAVAVEALARLGDGYELVLAGEEWPGGAAEVEAAARRLHVTSQVRRVGQITDEALATLYAEAYAAMSLSRCESFGLPVAEAMRAGVPVVVADEAWSRELTADAAEYADGDDPAAVAAAVRRLDDADLWRTRSIAASERAAEFTWRRTAAGIARAAADVATRADARRRS